MEISKKKLFFDKEKFNKLEENGSVVFTSNKYFSWFKTSLTGKDILLKLNGEKSLDKVIEEISEEYKLNKAIIEEDIYKFCKTALDKNILFESMNDCKEIEFNTNVKSIYIDITNKCNLNCIYCNKNICDGEKELFLEPKDMEAYLYEITRENDGRDILINISGGEPLLHHQIEDIFKVIKKFECRITLWTNGVLLDEEKAKLIKKYCDYIMISLDHVEKEANDYIRGLGSYDAVIKSSKLCEKNEIPFFIATTPTKYNLNILEKFISFSYDIEAKGFIINEPILVRNDNSDISQHFEYSINELQKKYSYIRKRTAIINSWKNNKLKFDKDEVNLIFIEDTKRCLNSVFNISFKESCGAGVNEILIDVNGDVYPCHALNINNYSLGTVKNYLRNRQQYIKMNDIGSCNNCDYSIFCLGGCRAQALFHTNDIYGKYPFCEYEKENYKQVLSSPLKAVEMNE